MITARKTLDRKGVSQNGHLSDRVALLPPAGAFRHRRVCVALRRRHYLRSHLAVALGRHTDCVTARVAGICVTESRRFSRLF
jgi:hypothetical protein